MPYFPRDTGAWYRHFELTPTLPRVHAWADLSKYYTTSDFDFYFYLLPLLTENFELEENGDILILNFAGYLEAREIFFDFYGSYPGYFL